MSPDGRRIYDVRESYCNVWEPNALTRLAEADERASETSSSHAGSATLSLASEASASVLEPITALAVSTRGSAYCSGNDGGLLTHVSDSGAKTEAVLGYMGVTLVAWSDDDSMIATAELDGSVNVRRVPVIDPAEKLLEARSSDPVLQLLFVDQGTTLLVRSTRSTTTWSLESKGISVSRPLDRGPVQWLPHPNEPHHLLSVTAAGISLCDTAFLQPLYFWRFDHMGAPASAFEPAKVFPQRLSEIDTPQQGGTGPIGPSLRKIWIAPDKETIVVEMACNHETTRRATQLMTVDICAITTRSVPRHAPAEASPNLVTEKIAVHPLPRQALDLIQMPLGFIDDNLTMSSVRPAAQAHKTAEGRVSLVFVDHDFWVCAWSLGDLEGSNVRRYFFLPHDWVSIDCLELAQITRDGRFLCPRNGEVAVVSQGLCQEWVE